MKKIFLLLTLLLTATLISCGDDEETKAEADYVDALPSYEFLELKMDESVSKRDSTPSTFKEATIQTMNQVNQLLQNTHSGIESIITKVEPTVFEGEKGKCKQWASDTTYGVSWKVWVCKKEANAFHTYLVTAKKTTEEDGAYKFILGGKGNILPKYEGKRRSFGYVAYNFDNLKEVMGEMGAQIPTGKLGIGYRANGATRVLNIGLKDIKAGGSPMGVTTLYHYRHIIGVGGVFKYLTYSDVIAKDETDKIVFGQDEVKEFGRRIAVWSTKGSARTATQICGGTLGQGNCVANAHCWSADGNVTYNEIVEGTVDWTSCDAVSIDEEITAPTDEELTVPTQEDTDSGAPVIEIPAE